MFIYGTLCNFKLGAIVLTLFLVPATEISSVQLSITSITVSNLYGAVSNTLIPFSKLYLMLSLRYLFPASNSGINLNVLPCKYEVSTKVS